jgi:hypothetical protein
MPLSVRSPQAFRRDSISADALGWSRGGKVDAPVSHDNHLVTLEVLVVRKYDWALLCRIGTTELAIPVAVIRSPTPLPLAGQPATLAVERWFAVDNGLV